MKQSRLGVAFLILAFTFSAANAQVWNCGQSMVETGKRMQIESVPE